MFGITDFNISPANVDKLGEILNMLELNTLEDFILVVGCGNHMDYI